ncbi:hypothetical protein [uncultured Cetobacterium sp.]|uniref:hypothetical protein n=1 Tax=uncultured Cetobacterium sp. TaxID=527638 RepID=UPI002608D8C9|nr:hypothetical protein [uncultured Cetobacterium sp.]
MKRKVRDKIFFLFFLLLLFSNKIYGENRETLDDAYVEIHSKKLKDDFFLVKYDFDRDKVFVGLKTLFYFLEIYTVEINLEDRSIEGEIDGKKIDIKFSQNECKVIDDDLYIDLNVIKNKLPFDEAEWSGENLKLTLNPTFVLPYEEREKSKVERLRLNDQKSNKKYRVVRNKNTLISPGLLKINFMKNDIENAEENINLEYGTQFLYGDLYINQKLKPQSELENYKWTYNDLYKENDLVIGDFYLRTPDFLRVNSSVEGISFGKENTYSSTENNVTIIEGEAQGADIIELYQNGMLIDYKNPTTRRFEFKIRERNYGGEYSLKIYYKNGQIENRKVYTLSDVSILNKDEVNYNIQYGKSDEKLQSIFQVDYGVTDDLSLGIGVMNLFSENKREFNIVKSELAYRTNFDSFPTLLSLKNFYEYDKKENSYELKIDQKLKDINLIFKRDEYSKYLGEENNVKYHNEIGLLKEFSLNRIAFGYLEEVDFKNNEKESGYYLSLENRSFRNYSLFIDTEYKKNRSNEKIIEINPGITYTGFNNISLLFQSNIENRDSEKNVDYSVKMLSRRRKIKDSSIEYNFSGEVRYNDADKFLFTLDFNLYFDGLFYLELPVNRSEENDYTVGINAEKVIDLSNLKRVVKDREVDNSWIFGKVFIDTNSNKIYDKGEKTIPDIKIIVDGKKFQTNSKGEYISDGLLPQEKYKVEIDRKSIDPMLKQIENNVRVETKASVGTEYNIPVQAISMVTGNILKGEGISSDEFIRIVSMTTIVLEKNGEFYKEIDPEFDGLYFFDDVLPGEYDLKFNYLGSDPIIFTGEKTKVIVKLENDDEGEYFEGFDVTVNKTAEDKIKKVKKEQDSDVDDFDVDSILNNF